MVQMSNEEGWTPEVLDVGQIRENQIMNVKIVLGTGIGLEKQACRRSHGNSQVSDMVNGITTHEMLKIVMLEVKYVCIKSNDKFIFRVRQFGPVEYLGRKIQQVVIYTGI